MSKIDAYFAIEKHLRWRLLLLVFGGVVVIIPAALALSNGLLSPRGFARVMIAYMACTALVAFIMLRNARANFQVSTSTDVEVADDAIRNRFRKKIRSLQIGVGFFAIVLVYALWSTQGEPWMPRLIGAAMSLLIQYVMIQSIRRMQRQLKQETSDQRQ